VFIVQACTEGFQTFAASQGNMTATATMPISVGDPVYGSKDPKFTDFIAPGMIITISFAQSIGITAVSFVLDKKTGNMDRMWACGVRPMEVLAAAFMIQMCNILIQVSLLLFFALFIFKLPMLGNLGLVLLLALLLGMTGMMLGLLISSVCEEEQAAMQVAMGCFFPALLLSGIIWPIEGVPLPLRYISYCLPTTWAANAMRSIMCRGWGMGEPSVYTGYGVTLGWIAFLFIIASRSLKSKQ